MGIVTFEDNIKNKEIKEETMTDRRLVQVYIVDPNENVPLEKAVLYKGAEKLTDLTDRELFFEIGIKEILNTYNAYRITLKDKNWSGGMEKYLEPARIRDLSMAVVTLAKFEKKESL